MPRKIQSAYLVSREVFDVFFGVKSCQSFDQLRAEGIRQFTNFEAPDLIESCRFIFEFARGQAIIGPEQEHRTQFAAKFEDAQ
jgi:hypothetical protein